MDSCFSTNYITGLEVLRDQLPVDSYTLAIPALRSLENLDFPCPVTFFTGENGSGKSTLLEAVAVAYGFNPEGVPEISSSPPGTPTRISAPPCACERA